MARRYVASKERNHTIMWYDEYGLLLMCFRTKLSPNKDIVSKDPFNGLIENDEYYIDKEVANKMCKHWYKELKNNENKRKKDN